MATKNVPWEIALTSTLSLDFGKKLLVGLKREVDWNLSGRADQDVVYLSYLSKGILGDLLEGDRPEAIDRVAREQILRAEELYPAIRDIEFVAGERPDVAKALKQVEARQKELGSPDEEPDFDESELQLFLTDWSENELFDEPEPVAVDGDSAPDSAGETVR
jgi:hypothetical protein